MDTVFQGHNADKIFYKERPYANDPEVHVHIVRAFSTKLQLQRDIKVNEQDSKSRYPGAWERIEDLFVFYDRLQLIRRFLDGRNPEIETKALPDGSNIANHALRREWLVHRHWIRALDYQSLNSSLESIDLRRNLSQALAALEVELHTVGRVNPGLSIDPKDQPPLPPYFAFFDEFCDVTITILRSVAKGIVADPRQFLRSEMDVSSRIGSDEYTHEDAENLKWLVKATLDKIPTSINFYATLLNFASNFESRMLSAYVDNSSLISHSDEHGGRTVSDIKLARQIAEVNSHRRGYHLMTDWSGSRPWKQLWHILNTAPGEQDYYRVPIKEFHEKIEDLKAFDRVSIFESPSNPSNIWARLFPIHPIDRLSPPPHLLTYADGCSFCLSSYRPRETLAELRCEHLFHFTCLRKYWDRYSHCAPCCPTCRSMIPSLAALSGISEAKGRGLKTPIVSGSRQR